MVTIRSTSIFPICIFRASVFLVLGALGLPISHAADTCVELLKLARNSSLIYLDDKTIHLYEFLAEESTTLESARKTAGKAGIPLMGLDINGSASSEDFSNWKRSIRKQISDGTWNNISLLKETVDLNKIGSDLVSQCLSSEGLKFWADYNPSDEDQFTLHAKWVGITQPATISKFIAEPEGSVNCKGMFLSKVPLLEAESFSRSALETKTCQGLPHCCLRYRNQGETNASPV